MSSTHSNSLSLDKLLSFSRLRLPSLYYADGIKIYLTQFLKELNGNLGQSLLNGKQSIFSQLMTIIVVIT